MGKNILVIEDDKVLSGMIGDQLQQMGHEVFRKFNWAEASEYLSVHEPNLILLDCRLPDIDGHEVIRQIASLYPVMVFTAYGSVQGAVRAMKDGAADYLTKPVNLDELELAVQRVLDHAAMRQDHQFCKDRMRALQHKNMVGRSEVMQKVYELISAVAPSDMTVLIQGESGVGKELVAHEIHTRSLRTEKNFVVLDCCTLHETLFESELFGHERSAFTGADRRKPGLIEGAEGGTLFLDEVGEIDLSVQAKLLRVLESGQFRRLGGTKDLQADVRIVAATNRDLENMSREGTFRVDLYYRLSSFVIHVPPLRERREDIPELVNHFIHNHDFSRRVDKSVSSSAMKQLISYDWRGNIRELKNVVERAIILSDGASKMRPEHLTFANTRSTQSLGVELSFAGEPTLEEVQRNYLKKMLTKYSGHRLKVANALGISERNLYRLIRKYDLQ
ncbi:MAG: sigma-54 dependent transcriptional regulator [Pseudomonadota bacterium]